jgi:hypothetical protein
METEPNIDVIIKGKSAEAIKRIQNITGKSEPVEVIISALRLYEWVLAQQTKDAVIVCEYGDDSPKEGKELELVNFVKNKDVARSFFKGRDTLV